MSNGAERVLITWPGFDPGDDETAGALRRQGFEIDFLAGKNHSRERFTDALQDATAAIISTDRLDRETLALAPRLRIIARTGVGVDGIDLDAATNAGIVVTTTPGANDQTCADHALALMLALIRRVGEHDRSVRAGEWDRGGDLTPVDLHGCCVGLVGFGRIGQAVAQRLDGFGVEILVTDPAVSEADGRELVDLDDLLARADIVSLHAALSPETRAMIGEHELGRMREGSILVNTARGELVDEFALIDALRAGKPAAAGLDVFLIEPPSASPLLEFPNVVLSPHIGGLSVGSIRAVTAAAVGSIIDLAEGRTPSAVVNPEVLRDDQIAG